MLGIGVHLLSIAFAGEPAQLRWKAFNSEQRVRFLGLVGCQRRERRALRHLTTNLVQLIEQPNGVGVSGAHEDKTFPHHSCERARATRVSCSGRLFASRIEASSPQPPTKPSLCFSLGEVTPGLRRPNMRPPTPCPFVGRALAPLPPMPAILAELNNRRARFLAPRAVA